MKFQCNCSFVTVHFVSSSMDDGVGKKFYSHRTPEKNEMKVFMIIEVKTGAMYPAFQNLMVTLYPIINKKYYSQTTQHSILIKQYIPEMLYG